MLTDPLLAMSIDELVSTLQMIGTPIMVELARRGYRVRLDDKHSASGVPVFVAAPTPRVVAK